jgi:hypothetical protein
LKIGITLSAVIALLLGFMYSWQIAMKITGGVGAISWVIAGVFSGAFISGDRMRANDNIETMEDNKSRNKLTSIFFIFGIPHLIIWIARMNDKIIVSSSYLCKQL